MLKPFQTIPLCVFKTLFEFRFRVHLGIRRQNSFWLTVEFLTPATTTTKRVKLKINYTSHIYRSLYVSILLSNPANTFFAIQIYSEMAY